MILGVSKIRKRQWILANRVIFPLLSNSDVTPMNDNRFVVKKGELSAVFDNDGQQLTNFV